MPESPGSAYNRAVQEARLAALTGSSSATSGVLRTWDRLLAATIEAIVADVQAGKLTPERADALRKSVERHMGRLNTAYNSVLEGGVVNVAGATAKGHVAGAEAAAAAAGVGAKASVRASMREVPKRALEYSLARRQGGGSQALKGLAAHGIQHVAGSVDDILFTGVARGASSQRVAGELAAAMAGGDEAVLAAVKSSKLRRQLRSANPNDPVYKAAQGLRRYGRMVAVSELNEAHRSASVLAAQRSGVVGGLRWTRSGRHDGLRSSPCECDLLATQDLHGMGPGVYPVNAYPAAPHPYCACLPEMVVMPPEKWGSVPVFPQKRPASLSPDDVEKTYQGLGGKPTPAAAKRAAERVNVNTTLAYAVGQKGHQAMLAQAEAVAAQSAQAAAAAEGPWLKRVATLGEQIAAATKNVALLKALIAQAEKLAAEAAEAGAQQAAAKAGVRLAEAQDALAAKQLANKVTSKKAAAKAKLADGVALLEAGHLEKAQAKLKSALPDAAFAGADDLAAEIEAALAKAKSVSSLDGAGFPASAAGLEHLVKEKGLGGSTGAALYRHPATGQRYVLKRGASAGHLREEAFADAAYQAAGARVPAFRLYEAPDGPTKLSRFLEGAQPLSAVLDGADEALKTSVLAQLREDFALDAVLGNWDVVGQGLDNVLVDVAGNAWRIDNGGALRYRAMGTKKTAQEWSKSVSEVDSLRGIDVHNPSAKRVFGAMTDQDVADSIKRALPKRQAVLDALPAEIRPMVSARFDDLEARLAQLDEVAQAKAVAAEKTATVLDQVEALKGNVAGLKKTITLADEAVAAAKLAGDQAAVDAARAAKKAAEDALAAKQLANQKTSKKAAAKKKATEAQLQIDAGNYTSAKTKLQSALADAIVAEAGDLVAALEQSLGDVQALASGAAEKAKQVSAAATALADKIAASKGSVAQLKGLVQEAEELMAAAMPTGLPGAIADASAALKKAQDTLFSKQLANKVSSTKAAAKKALVSAEGLLAKGSAKEAAGKAGAALKKLESVSDQLPPAEAKALMAQAESLMAGASGKSPAPKTAAGSPQLPPKPKQLGASEAKAVAAAEEQMKWAQDGTSEPYLQKTIGDAAAAQKAAKALGGDAGAYAGAVAEQAGALAQAKLDAIQGTLAAGAGGALTPVAELALKSLAEQLVAKAKSNSSEHILKLAAKNGAAALKSAKALKAPAAILSDLQTALEAVKSKAKADWGLASKSASAKPAKKATTPKGITQPDPPEGVGDVTFVKYSEGADSLALEHEGEFKRLTSVDAKAWGKKRWKAWAGAVSKKAVLDGADYYKGSGYTPMNSILRSGHKPTGTYTDTQSRKAIRLADEALDRADAVMPEDTMLFRGTGFDKWHNLTVDDIGKVIEDKAYMSTSLSRSFAHSWALGKQYNGGVVLMEIRMPKGAPGAFLDAFSGLQNQSEYEVLLPRSQKFRVTGVRTEMVKQGSTKWVEMRILECEYVEPGPRVTV